MGPAETKIMRTALSMVRADWQGDDESWAQLWADVADTEALALALTTLCRENVEQLASVAGISMGEMLHRMAGRLIPHPDGSPVSRIDLRVAGEQVSRPA